MKMKKVLIMLVVSLLCLEAARMPNPEDKGGALGSPRRKGHRRHGSPHGSDSSYGSSSGSSSGPGSGSGYGSGYGSSPGGGGGYGYGYGDSSGNGYGGGGGFIPGHSSVSHNESHYYYFPPMPLPPNFPGFP